MPASVFTRRKAFSITELLVVVAVILILAGLIFVGANTLYVQAMQVKCQHNLEQIGQACLMYASKNYGQYPKAWDMELHRRWYDALLEGSYIDNPVAIGCPLEPDPPLAGGLAGSFEGSEAVIRALEWLKARQELVGSTKGYWKTTNPSGATEHRSPHHQIGVTSLALRAFIHNGCTDRYPTRYADTVDRTINWLIGKQEANGKFPGYTGDNGLWYQYDHAVATLAMCETYMQTGRADVRAAAEKALAHVLEMQGDKHGYGWSYNTQYSDAPLTNWMFQAVAAGRKAGLISGAANADQNARALTQMVRSNYTTIYRYGPNDIDDRGAVRTQAATAGSLVSHLLLGASGPVPGILNALRGNRFTYARGSGFELYNYFYLTLGYSLRGGTDWDEWQKEVFPHELVNRQTLVQINGEDAGYWVRDICLWGRMGYYMYCYEYTTALAANVVLAGQPGYWHLDRMMGKCSYGYNSLVGDSRRNPSAGTILAMDYDAYIIVRGIRDDAGNLDPNLNDGNSYMAFRHGGKANVLFADGAVRALGFSDFKEGMWTPEPGD